MSKDGKRKVQQIKFERSSVVMNENRDILREKVSGDENVPNSKTEDTEEEIDARKPDTYTTEVPSLIEKKTGMMRQVLSGMERLFKIVKSALGRMFSWMTGRMKPTDGECV